ncbi:hypothetical protein ISR94_00310 [Candidatus Microgenomates bacterium]|nr:hypothetical protein [Candidatus Microgenomates bacterium]
MGVDIDPGNAIGEVKGIKGDIKVGKYLNLLTETTRAIANIHTDPKKANEYRLNNLQNSIRRDEWVKKGV